MIEVSLVDYKYTCPYCGKRLRTDHPIGKSLYCHNGKLHSSYATTRMVAGKEIVLAAPGPLELAAKRYK